MSPRFALLILMVCSACTTTRSVTILHFSDYHSHAVPFYADGEGTAAGIARAMAYIAPLSARSDVLVFSGGDTMNRGAPAWSDKYGCVEWSWWNGIVDAMAFGNHDADYGAAVFSACLDSIDYPILGANVVGNDAEPVFLYEGEPYVVFESAGVRLGVFALAGTDFETLLGESNSPTAGIRFNDRVEVARGIVAALRAEEHVDAVVLIGHASTEDDEALARAVAGLDLILGTHSHRLESLHKIEGTETLMVSPGQYLSHVSRTKLTVGRSGLAIAGDLVTMGSSRQEDASTAARVTAMQRELESDPEYSALFRAIASLDSPLSNEGVNERNSQIGALVMNAIRISTGADVAVSISSSFRGGLPSGEIRESDLRDVLPYDNHVLRYELSGSSTRELIDLVGLHRGSDSFCQVVGPATLEENQTYVVATTDYMAKVSIAYRDFFARFRAVDTGETVREALRRAIVSE